MTEYFRIFQRKHAGSPMTYGLGAARWNPRGIPIIYAGSSVAIITTEFLSIWGGTVIDSKWSMATYSIEGSISSLDVGKLPKDWDSRPYPLSTQDFGRKWAQTNYSVCLKIPSSRILLKAFPREHNLLINPLHKDFAKEIQLVSVDDLHFNLNEWATGDK